MENHAFRTESWGEGAQSRRFKCRLLFLAASDLAPFMLHLAIAIEDITEDTFTLAIVNAPGAITVKIGDGDSYAEAAKRIGDCMLALQSDPRAVLGFVPYFNPEQT
jgi:hypothetical protein